MIVGITGADGFFGWHAALRLLSRDIEMRRAGRSTFASADQLDAFVSECDVVLHLAGVNRASDDEITNGNIGLAQALVDAARRTGNRFDVVYANSTQSAKGGVYGDAKRRAAEVLEAFARDQGSRFVNVVCPHLFGEFGRPFYNSAVATFAHQLVVGEESTVSDGQLELLHIGDAADLFIDAALDGTDQIVTLEPAGRQISVRDTYDTMARLADYVTSGEIPDIADDFELHLFNTIRSQMWPSSYPMPLVRHCDDRGAFFETVRAHGMGQTSISTTVPGITRGEHYHLEKIERFVVIAGQAQIRVRRLFTDELVEFDVDGEAPVVIDMPTGCTHDITNTGDGQLTTLFWSHDHFDPAHADTYPMPVVGTGLSA